MKKSAFIFLLSIPFVLAPLFSQTLPSVGIQPFTFSGAGVSDGDAAEATRALTAELKSWDEFPVMEGADAGSADYIVQGQVSRQNNQISLTVTTTEARSKRVLSTSRAQAASLGAVSMESLCTQVVELIPYPNYLLGRWQSTINMVDGPVICIMEFRADRTVSVRRFDTWEYSAPNSLKYQGIGDGTYSYTGYRRRTVSAGGRQIQADATFGLNVKLEDALPKYSEISVSGIRILFDDNKANLELVNAGLPCGDNKSGPSVYPDASVFYTKFAKIQ